MGWIVAILFALVIFWPRKKVGSKTDGGQGQPDRGGVNADIYPITVRVLGTVNPNAEYLWPQNTAEDTKQWSSAYGEDFYLNLGDVNTKGVLLKQIGTDFSDYVYKWRQNGRLLEGINLEGDVILNYALTFPCILPDGAIHLNESGLKEPEEK